MKNELFGEVEVHKIWRGSGERDDQSKMASVDINISKYVNKYSFTSIALLSNLIQKHTLYMFYKLFSVKP
jgi:hypothetical protein